MSARAKHTGEPAQDGTRSAKTRPAVGQSTANPLQTTSQQGLQNAADGSAVVSDLAALQRMADTLGSGGTASGVVQRAFTGDSAFTKITRAGFVSEFASDLGRIGFKDKREIYEAIRDSGQSFSKDQIPAEIARLKEARAASAPEAASSSKPMARSDIEAAVEDASETALSEAMGAKASAPEPATADKAKGPEAEVVDEAPPAESPKLIINYVWLGDAQLDALSRFNIHSWRALGHAVNIYTVRFDGKTATHGTLGLEDGDATVKDLRAQLVSDEAVTDAQSPKAKLTDARSLLTHWLSQVATGKQPAGDLRYNMVDLTKSYIGGSQRGIVLDLKVGPSEHLSDYAESFSSRFVSYARGGNTGAGVENQSMGTMQESDEMRGRYAASFNANVKMNLDGLRAKPTEKWFNTLTSFHGRAFGKLVSKGTSLNTSKQTPQGAALGPKDFPVAEPGGTGQGPFRVFKHASDQTNKGITLTKQEDVNALITQVYETQLAGLDDETGQVARAESVKDEVS